MTEDTPGTATPAAPVIDEAAAREAAEHAKMMADLEARRIEEAAIAAVQDAALQAVKDGCAAGRAALERAR